MTKIKILKSVKYFLTPEHAEQVWINKVDSCIIWNCRQLPGQRKSHQGGRQQFQHSVFGNSQHLGARFGHIQPHHTQAQHKWEPTTVPKTCLATKNLNKCSIDKFCLMTGPPVGQQRVERNRTKLYARIKYSMLIFISISFNKNNSFCNSEGQKKVN